MHPVMITLPGWFFKLLAPGMILWRIVTVIIAMNRRTAAQEELAKAAAADAARAAATKSKPKAKSGGDSKRSVKDDSSDDDVGGRTAAPAAAAPGLVDNWINFLLPVAIGIGLFLYAAPVHVPEGALITRIGQGLLVFARSIVRRDIWAAQWQSLPIYSYGVMLGSSLVVGWYVTLTLAARQGMNREKMQDCYVFTAFSAIIGSRVLYILTNLHEFHDARGALSFSAMLALRSGGLVAYGGFLGGLLGSIVFLRRNNLSLWKWADAAVPSLATGLMITRLGCYMYGCDFGKPLGAGAPGVLRRLGTFPHWADDRGAPAWQQHVALGFGSTERDCVERFHGDWRYHADSHQWLCHIDRHAHASVPVHPTQLYESLTGLTIFVVLMWLWKRRKFEGQIFLAFGALYGFARSALEIIRDDHERGSFAGLSTSQLIGLSSGILAIIVYVIRSRTAPRAIGASLFGGENPAAQPAPGG